MEIGLSHSARRKDCIPQMRLGCLHPDEIEIEPSCFCCTNSVDIEPFPVPFHRFTCNIGDATLFLILLHLLVELLWCYSQMVLSFPVFVCDRKETGTNSPESRRACGIRARLKGKRGKSTKHFTLSILHL